MNETQSSDYEILFKDTAASEDTSLLDAGIGNYVESIFGKVAQGGLVFLARRAGETIGGVSGYWGAFGWLYVDQLWVSDNHRGKGIGTRLMKLIEEEAVNRGCRNVYLYTMSFQAPDFYKRLGYSVFGELEDFPTGHSRLFLRKGLV